MIRYSRLARFSACILSLTMVAAVAEEIPELAAGRYVCATVTTGALLDAMEVTVEREGEQVTAIIQAGDALLAGKQLGNRLFLVRQDIYDFGLEIVQVVGTVRSDGTVTGSATRTLDGNVIERGAFTLRRLGQ